MNIRIGFGVDVHRLAEGLPLIIGGVKIPSEFGSAFSNADLTADLKLSEVDNFLPTLLLCCCG